MEPLTYNADRETLAPGRLRTRFSCGPRNYLDAADQWRKIDYTFRADSGRLSLSTAPYLLDCPRFANGVIRFENTSRFDIRSKTIRTDAAKGVTKTYHTASAVQGIAFARGALYRDAFPNLNASLLIESSPRGAKMLVVFHSEPPGDGPVEIPFTLDLGGESPLRPRTLAEPDLRTRQFFDAGIVIGQDPFRRVTLARPMVWDSGRRRARRRTPIRLRVERIGGQIICTKLIPRTFFRGATYPVFTDTTSTFYPARDGSTARGIGGSEEDLATIRAGVGNFVEDANYYHYLLADYVFSAFGFAILARNPIAFDTSAIPDGDTVSSADLTLFNQGDTDDVASQSCCLCEGTVSDPIVASDYEGNAASPEVAGNRITLADFISNGEGTFSGIDTGHINKAGETPFVLRLSCDVDNSMSGFSELGDETPIFSHYTSDEAGTASDPALVVEHAGGGGGLAIPIAAYHYNHHLGTMA